MEIDAASIDTRNPDRDAHLRSPDFLDAEKFPTVRYEGRAFEALTGDRFRLLGNLTLHGVTREVALEGEFRLGQKDPWGKQRALFTATASLNRKDFGLAWNQVLETGGVLVADRVELEVEVEAVQS